MTAESIRQFKDRQERWGGRLFSMETRKVIFPTDRILDQENALKEALLFEELYLSFKLERESWLSRSD